jgi:hypothetical protein
VDADSIIGAVNAVTKKWARQRKAEERLPRRASGRPYIFRSYRVTIKDAAGAVMKSAYMKTGSDNRYPAHARQIMYAARGPVQERTHCLLDDHYFCQTLLPDYLKENPEETASWDVVFDARGHLHEPHGRRTVPLGTIDVRRYLNDIARHEVGGLAELIAGRLDGLVLFPTCGPGHKFGAILFIEKEGFMSLFRAVNLADRYDIAIMSTKGLSVTASRLLVDQLCDAYSIPLLVLHDFDKSGFSIVGTLRHDTRRYAFANEINVIDLGLRLKDVQEWRLESEAVSYGKTNPAPNLRTNGATAEEIAFLCGGGAGRRVELNAFSSGDFVRWIEAKLARHGVSKVIPDPAVLEEAYRRAATTALLRKRLKDAVREAQQDARQLRVPPDLGKRVLGFLAEHPRLSWGAALAVMAGEELEGSGDRAGPDSAS